MHAARAPLMMKFVNVRFECLPPPAMTVVLGTRAFTSRGGGWLHWVDQQLSSSGSVRPGKRPSSGESRGRSDGSSIPRAVIRSSDAGVASTAEAVDERLFSEWPFRDKKLPQASRSITTFPK